MPYIPTEPVESSNIEAIGYDRKTSTLRVVFHGGRAYDYPMVPPQEYRKLLESESKGKFLNTRIKPLYAYRTPRPEELVAPPVASLEVGADEFLEYTRADEERDDLLDVPCRCCGLPILVPPEDACDLCVACYGGKGGDTNDPCSSHPYRVDVACPHGADDRSCADDCVCACHWQPIPIVEHERPQLTSEPDEPGGNRGH